MPNHNGLCNILIVSIFSEAHVNEVRTLQKKIDLYRLYESICRFTYLQYNITV